MRVEVEFEVEIEVEVEVEIEFERLRVERTEEGGLQRGTRLYGDVQGTSFGQSVAPERSGTGQ